MTGGPDSIVRFVVALQSAQAMDIATTEPASASPDSLEFIAHCPLAHHHAQATDSVSLLDRK
jgi:hypothetical protein